MFPTTSPKVHRGDIYYVQSDYSEVGSEMHAGRPALVISNDTFNAESAVVTVVYLTTRPKYESKAHVMISSSSRPSTVICEQISTIDKVRLMNLFGKATEAEMSAVEAALKYALGISDESDYDGCEPEQEECAGCTELEKVCAERDTYKKIYEDLITRLSAK